jgi:hypothetical protein
VNRPLMLAVAIGVLLPAVAGAQETPTESRPAQPIQEGIILPARPATVSVATVTTTAPAPQTAGVRKRRGMVGYIEDATVTSKVRLRFDLGYEYKAPDRAEFFYAKCGCYQKDAAPFGDPDAPGPGTGVPTELNAQQFYALGEYVIGTRASLFAELPFRAIQPQGFLDFGPDYVPFDDQSGIGDIRAGAKFSLMADDTRDVTLMFRAGLPTGDASKGTSTDTWTIEPALLIRQDVNERVGIEAQFGTLHPFGGSRSHDSDDKKFSGHIIFYGVGPSFDVVDNEQVRFTPVAELVGWRVIGGSQTLCFADLSCDYPADDNIVNLKLGARATISGRHSLYGGYGWALTDAAWYDKIVRFEYRYEF